MAIKSLRWRSKELEEKDGSIIFDGKPHEFYAWLFSVNMSKQLIEAESDKAKQIKEFTKTAERLVAEKRFVTEGAAAGS